MDERKNSYLIADDSFDFGEFVDLEVTASAIDVTGKSFYNIKLYQTNVETYSEMYAMSQMEAIDSSIESSGYGSDAVDNALKVIFARNTD